MTARSFFIAAMLTLVGCCGCGTIKGRSATDQLLVSNAVDRSIEQIQFGKLAGARVYLDSTYLNAVRSVGFVNSEYILSSLRERMVRSHCKLQEKPQDADYIVEIRVGALGTDSHEVNYGIPGNQALNQTASMLSSSPIPALPEFSFARKDERRAAAKLAIFAYHRESKEPVWETGSIQATSLAKSTWILGAGPFQQGEIYEENGLATSPGEELAAPILALFDRKKSDSGSLVDTAPEMLAEVDGPVRLLPTPSPASPQTASTSTELKVGWPQADNSKVVTTSATE